jgi:sugar phosphate isomerase/epimerase
MDVKFGACEWALPGNGVDSIGIAREVGLSGLQLGFVSYERGFLLSQKRFRDFYMDEADKHKIEIPSMAVCEFDNYGLKNPKNTEKGKIAYEIIDLAIEAAADMRMKMIMMPSFVDGFIDTDEDLAITAESLEKLYDILYPEIHFKDGIGNQNSSRLLGDGDTDFYGTMSFLKKKNYSGWIHLENLYDRLPLRLKSPKNYIDVLKMDLDILKAACE